MIGFGCLLIALQGVTLEAAENQSLYPAREQMTYDSKWGYIDNKGEWVIDPIYEQAESFSEGYAVVVKETGYGAVDIEGKEVIPCSYVYLQAFKDGVALCITKEGMHVIDSNNHLMTQAPYEHISPYAQGMAVVVKTIEDKPYYGYINQKGEEIIPLQYLYANPFEAGKALVQMKDGQYALINQTAEVEQKFIQSGVYNYSENRAVYREDSEQGVGYIDAHGKAITPPKYETATAFEGGVAIVGASTDSLEREGLINLEGELIYPVVYNDIQLLGENRVALGRAIDPEAPYKGSLYAIGDTKGNKLTEDLFYGVGRYKKGLASVTDGESTYFVDLTGKPAEGFYKLQGKGELSQEQDLIQATIDSITFYYDGKGILVYAPSTDEAIDEVRKIKAAKYRPNVNYVVYYPQLEGLADKTVERKINQTLREAIWQKTLTPEEKLDYSYYSNFVKLYHKGDLLSIEQKDSTYYFGAAHPNTQETIEHIDLKTGDFYKLKDLFQINCDYEKVLKEQIVQLAQEPGMKEKLYVTPQDIKVAPEHLFYVNETSLFIVYQPYEIGPYAAGNIVFEIPLKNIENCLDLERPFWKSMTRETLNTK